MALKINICQSFEFCKSSPTLTAPLLMSTSIIDIIRRNLAGKGTFSTADLRNVLLTVYPGAAEKTLDWKIYKLKEEGLLHQIGRGVYSFNTKSLYVPELSLKTKRYYNKLKTYCAGFSLVVWDTKMLADIAEIPIDRHYIFFAIPKEKLEPTFNQLLDFSKKIFLNPAPEVISRYLLPQEEAAVFFPLVTETPVIQIGDFHILTIEALLVSARLMNEDYLHPLGVDIKQLFQKAFLKYNVNENKLLRYAARRDKRSEIEQLNSLKTYLSMETIGINKEALVDNEEATTTEDVVLEDNQLVCLLTGATKKASSKEATLQSLIRMLNEEYGFDLEEMERDFKITYQDPDTAKSKSQKVDLVVFSKGASHDQANIIRICVVQDEKVKDTDKAKGLVPTLENAMGAMEGCEFGLWTNGAIYHFLQKEEDAFGNEEFTDLSDFPGEGQTLEDLDRHDRSVMRNPANDSLVRVFKRCHDYIYGNEGMKKTAFWELLNLIFCKIYDEKRRFICAERGESYRRKFWVGVKEQNTDAGRKAVAERIKSLFEELKTDKVFSEVFDGNERINLTDKGLAFIAGELAKYSFLDASVDVKGMAYETIVSNTLKQEAGQFFTPRNIIRCMVEMLDPKENQRVLDPACGSGGFLVMVLDHVRKKITKELFPNLSGPLLEEKYNSVEVNERVRQYAERAIFGFDFDPDLKKAARMNMVMSGDGHANIFHANSIAYPFGDNKYELDKIAEVINISVQKSSDKNFAFEFSDAREKFDLIFTNPPFGAKIPINDPDILNRYELGKGSASEPPEVLFIETCYNFLKPGGKLAIVLPDGILGNPFTIRIREWILNKFKVLASVDLPVETFLPQVGVQASLLFLQKKTEQEIQVSLVKEEDYEVFLAIAEKVGKDRRGVPIYLRDDDGGEILFEELVQYLVKDKNGEYIIKHRIEKIKKLNDDLPEIAKAYLNFKASKK